MRTVKHKIIPPSPEQEVELLALARAYQFEKNYWSDQLLNRLNRSHEASPINIDFSYNQIRDNLVKNKYKSKYNLPARIWKMALKEAYDLHIRTYEAQIAFLKRDINNKIYKFGDTLVTTHENKSEAEADEATSASLLNTFKEFLYFATNSLFYNYKTFRNFEEEFYSKKFRKARIYQRIKPILQNLLSKAIQKEVFKLNNDKEADNKEPSEDETKLKLATPTQLRLQENIKTIEQFLQATPKLNLQNNPNVCEKHCGYAYAYIFACLEQLLNYYCNCLVKAIVNFRNYKPIQSQINPTITLDGDCYELYSVYDYECKINRWFLNIMSMEKGKRIKGLELTGFHHAKKIMKHKKSPNLTLSFDATDMTYYAHFTFKNKAKPKKVKSARAIAKAKKCSGEAKSIKNNTEKCNCNYKYRYIQQKSGSVRTITSVADVVTHVLNMATMLTVGGDFGLTENYTFSDGWVSGRKQGKILNHIANKTKNSVAGLQRISEKGFFGVEKNNKTGKRNHKNNDFNHNLLLDNINKNYRKKQRKYNQFLKNYKYLLANEIIEHFTSDSIYGQYGNISESNKLTLVFEDLDYTSLGKNKSQKRQVNLIKGILNVLEEKIECYNLPIEIEYVNPAYTSQNCPNCYCVARANRNKAECSFRCQHCGFTAIDDERYQWLTKVVQRSEATATLPSEDDFIAACNIAERLSTVPDSTRLRLRDVKDRLMLLHDSVKVSCKMFVDYKNKH